MSVNLHSACVCVCVCVCVYKMTIRQEGSSLRRGLVAVCCRVLQCDSVFECA